MSNEKKASLEQSLKEKTQRNFQRGAGEGIRTLDINLGKVALYQLSYTREQKGNLQTTSTRVNIFLRHCKTSEQVLRPRESRE